MKCEWCDKDATTHVSDPSGFLHSCDDHVQKTKNLAKLNLGNPSGRSGRSKRVLLEIIGSLCIPMERFNAGCEILDREFNASK